MSSSTITGLNNQSDAQVTFVIFDKDARRSYDTALSKYMGIVFATYAQTRTPAPVPNPDANHFADRHIQLNVGARRYFLYLHQQRVVWSAEEKYDPSAAKPLNGFAGPGPLRLMIHADYSISGERSTD